MTRMIDTPHVFEVHFTYLEPQRGSIQIAAENAAHAESMIREHPVMKDAIQLDLTHIMDLGPYTITPPDNVIPFPKKKELN